MSNKISFELDGKIVEAKTGETIWQVAKRQGTSIPHLCWLPQPGYRADGFAGVMADASICGLGQAAPNPLLSVLKFFPEDLGA